MSLTEFLAIKTDLRYCPICAWFLVEDKTNTAIRVCPNHGKVFSIMATTTGYLVVACLTGDEK